MKIKHKKNTQNIRDIESCWHLDEQFRTTRTKETNKNDSEFPARKRNKSNDNNGYSSYAGEEKNTLKLNKLSRFPS